MRKFVEIAREKYKTLDITHLTQEDDGGEKNIALNRAIVASKYEYLIFIDGDCVPFDDFIENHVNASREKNCIIREKKQN